MTDKPKAIGRFATSAQLEALLETHRELEARVTELEQQLADLVRLVESARLSAPAVRGSGAVPALELDGAGPGPAATAAAARHGSMAFELGARVVVLLDRGGLWPGTYLGEVPGGARVDLGERAGEMVVAADRVQVEPVEPDAEVPGDGPRSRIA